MTGEQLRNPQTAAEIEAADAHIKAETDKIKAWHRKNCTGRGVLLQSQRMPSIRAYRKQHLRRSSLLFQPDK